MNSTEQRERVPVPASIWTWPELSPVAKLSFLWLWLEAGCSPKVVRFRPVDLATGLGRRQARQASENYLVKLEEAGLLEILSDTPRLVIAEIRDPEKVAVERLGRDAPARKRRMDIPRAIMTHGELSAEAKLSWIWFWNLNGCQPCEFHLTMRQMGATLGKEPRGAFRWWDFLQRCGFGTEIANNEGVRLVRMHDPEEAAEREGKLLMAEAKRRKKEHRN